MASEFSACSLTPWRGVPRPGGEHVSRCRKLTSGDTEAEFPRDPAGWWGFWVECGGAGTGSLELYVRTKDVQAEAVWSRADEDCLTEVGKWRCLSGSGDLGQRSASRWKVQLGPLCEIFFQKGSAPRLPPDLPSFMLLVWLQFPEIGQSLCCICCSWADPCMLLTLNSSCIIIFFLHSPSPHHLFFWPQ